MSETSIGHDSFIEDNIIKTDFIEPFDPAQIGITEIDSIKTGLTESDISENSSSKVNFIETNLPKGSTGKI